MGKFPWKMPLHPSRERLLPRFLDGEDTICSDIVKRLPDAAGPANLHILYVLIFTQPKMNSAIAGRGVPYRSGDFVPL